MCLHLIQAHRNDFALKFCKRGRIKGIEVVDDQWYAKRFEQLPANTP